MKTMKIVLLAAAITAPVSAQWVYIPQPAPGSNSYNQAAPSVDVMERLRAQNAADMERLEQRRAMGAQDQQARAIQQFANQQQAKSLGVVPMYSPRPF